MIDILLGLQWGDEGKGKIVDVLAPDYKVVARFQGGPNAGHTLEFDGKKHVLHQIPSGIFREDCINIIGNGVVLDPIIFKKEILGLKDYNIDFSKNLFISKKTAVIIPTHRILDAAYENSKGKSKIGSTLKGIGPAYSDKISRQGLRLGDILSDTFKEKYEKLVSSHKQILAFYKHEYELEEAEKEFFEAVEFIKGFNLVDGEYLLNEQLKAGTKVLAEGAQGSLLDVDFGSYPFVTSSNTTAAGVCSGLGVSPSKISEVYGIFKAYCTRVGSGPFPTELLDDEGERMRQEGREFGSTTGRPRRTGWLDLPALKYSIMLNGVTQLIMMKADVLNIFDEIKICTHYKLPDGTITEELPYDICDIEITPVYKTMKGWAKSLVGITDFEKMPVELQEYTSYIEKEVGVPVTYVSTSPDRTATLQRKSGL
ncbi:MAG: adenylosuccinate synthase [Cytophagaceae bacterium]|nr:adenylosuccinate synthase [Cytophagaceae bacterium]MBK9508468.1 adenylosuccinate synthase [Cytophagaceae bacterium]MBK9935510.1 adenylosuccinate synthase [Cytophagaceae bacterium]MBL0301953.1 adenylosuccinate synthase [Cytophagaceae bacterium]MBL0324779.1 adenylosuccinate synthase [Cytophagaceae bacterium]